jgi:hypothetical protein
MDVAVVDSFAYAGGHLLRIFDCSDPSDVSEVGAWPPPYAIRRVVYSAPYLYVACHEAGVCVLETVATAVAERGSTAGPLRTVRVGPNPTRGRVEIVLSDARTRTVTARILDIAGKEVMRRQVCLVAGRVTVDLRELPAGVYFVGLDAVRAASALKVLKQH